jgi:NADH-quinone oxidoreductase subunit L
MLEVTWLHLIPLLPLCGAAVCGLVGKKLPKSWLYSVALGTIFTSFMLGLTAFTSLGQGVLHERVFEWFTAGNLHVDLGLTIDRLSGTLVLVITGVGFLIHLYSVGYIDEDAGYWRYFAYLNLFVAAMLLLVLGDNLVAMFVGWEGVGLCSYLLIGFWFDDEAKASAGKKAFIVNRIGDFGFLLGIFTLFITLGSVSFADVNAAQIALVPASLAALFLFIGATGKSAQLPLYIWLPDAMAGPTPVSALIHAATMVTAGVYMVARLSHLYVQAPGIMALVAIIGCVTALWAALIATAQTDIKKVLAYSTVSQLGYMFIGVGTGAFFAGTEHLLTHAFFKACLFLGSGAVIHGLHGEQDMRKMGGLRKYMPHTAYTFLIATIAITGILPLSGYWSKDEILGQALRTGAFDTIRLGEHGPTMGWLGPVIYVLGTLTALLTAFYMARCYIMTFEGDYRGGPEVHPHESPALMTVPLWILAGLSVFGLFLGIPESWSRALHLESINWEHFTEGIFASVRGEKHEIVGEVVTYAVASIIAVIGVAIAVRSYWPGFEAAGEKWSQSKLYKAFENKLYVDEFYGMVIVRPLWTTARVLWRVVDVTLIDGLLINGSAQLVAFVGGIARRFQNGDVQRYAAVTAVGVAFLVVYFFSR